LKNVLLSVALGVALSVRSLAADGSPKERCESSGGIWVNTTEKSSPMTPGGWQCLGSFEFTSYERCAKGGWNPQDNSCAPASNQAEEQSKTYSEQLKRSDEYLARQEDQSKQYQQQLDRSTKLLDIQEQQAMRFGKLLEKWEKQSERFDAVLETVEKNKHK
jgi:hypothetical protein